MPTGHLGFDRFYDDLDGLTTGGTIIPAWSPDGKSLAFLEGPAQDRRGWLVDLATGDVSPLVGDVPALREAIENATGMTPAGRGLPFAHLAFAAARSLTVPVGVTQVLIDLDSGEVTRQPADSFADTYLGASEDAASVLAHSATDRPGAGARGPLTGRRLPRLDSRQQRRGAIDHGRPVGAVDQ